GRSPERGTSRGRGRKVERLASSSRGGGTAGVKARLGVGIAAPWRSARGGRPGKGARDSPPGERGRFSGAPGGTIVGCPSAPARPRRRFGRGKRRMGSRPSGTGSSLGAVPWDPGEHGRHRQNVLLRRARAQSAWETGGGEERKK